MMRRFAGWYGVAVGALIVAQWAFFLATGSVPELKTAPWSIGMHLAAEAALAVTLIWGGARVLRGHRGSDTLLLVGLGMAMYSEIASPGYFAQQGNWALVGMFAVLLAGAVVAAVALGRGEETTDEHG